MPQTRRDFIGSMAAAAAIRTGPGAPQFIVAALTMLNKSGRFDDGLNKAYLDHLTAGGADGALAMGTTGEFPSFSIAERKVALESFWKHKGKLSIMAQVGTSNIPETLDLLAHSTSLGVPSVLVIPPYYFKSVTTDGLAAFYEPILKASKVPVYFYNIPQLSGVPITPELLRKLSVYPNLTGIKDSFSPADVMLGFIRDFPKLKIITGVPKNLAVNLNEGGAGIISGNASVFVKQTTTVFDAYRKGAPTAEAQKALDEAGKALVGYDAVPTMKYMLSRMKLAESGYRPPFIELTPERKKQLDEAWRPA